MSAQFEAYQATIQDLEAVAEIFDQYRIFYGQQSDVTQARAFLFDRFEHRESIIFIVRDKSTRAIAGFTQLYPVFSSISMERSLILNDLYVGESYRRQGIAQLLLDEAKQYAQSIKAKGLELSTAIDNKQAQRLYERNGYGRDEDFYHYYLSVKGNETV
ncbi:GNAT family N-acetyltransferase [Paenibacillus sp. SC116]|uniref:GNAT family N-acetyltransferase n=1 Tax=Paenibacillus sp. SC116 TaxID=2968986 RepID=UPI00215A1C65|nr:GNAT family N-acetyltransferase [Paenibacillus sp. SC116]MCR8845623.1 GNAT family N-acetyltransferase [Paenibacillus sp. SC116]